MFTPKQIKYLRISLPTRINREEKYNLFTNQNVEEIDIARKIIRKESHETQITY